MTDATQEQMQAWLDERKKAKHSVQWLDVVMIGEQPVFAAVAALDGRANDWQAILDLTERQTNDSATLSKRLDTTNYFLTSISGHIQGKTLTGVALFHRGAAHGKMGVVNRFNAEKNLELSETQGFVAGILRPVTTASGQLYFGLYVVEAINSKSRHGMELNEGELSKFLESQREEGAYPVSVVPYEVAGQRRFAVTCREDSAELPWDVVRDLPAAELKTKAEELAKKGMTPVSISVYPHDGKVRYATVWRKIPGKEPAPSEK